MLPQKCYSHTWKHNCSLHKSNISLVIYIKENEVHFCCCFYDFFLLSHFFSLCTLYATTIIVNSHRFNSQAHAQTMSTVNIDTTQNESKSLFRNYDVDSSRQAAVTTIVVPAYTKSSNRKYRVWKSKFVVAPLASPAQMSLPFSNMYALWIFRLTFREILSIYVTTFIYV